MFTFHTTRSVFILSNKALFSSSRRFKPHIESIKKYESSLIHTNVLKNIDEKPSSGINDPELQQILKEMHRDFNIDADRQNLKQDVDSSSTDATTEDNHKKVDSDVDTKSYRDVEFSTDIIYDYDEERLLREKGLWEEKVKKREPKPEINYERGKTGVFDVDELVMFLREQRALDVVAIQVPPEAKFVDYLVISTGKSKNHINVLGEFLSKVYKKKKHPKERFIKLEGKGSDWVAIDMGNIALHIMSENLREEKDLETLWTVGPEYDQLCMDWQNPFPIAELLKKHKGNNDTL